MSCPALENTAKCGYFSIIFLDSGQKPFCNKLKYNALFIDKCPENIKPFIKYFDENGEWNHAKNDKI